MTVLLRVSDPVVAVPAAVISSNDSDPDLIRPAEDILNLRSRTPVIKNLFLAVFIGCAAFLVLKAHLGRKQGWW